jgi:hypothetical protein
MTFWIRANKISVIRFFIFRIWRPVTSFVLSNLEALRYLFHRKEALHDLTMIREQLHFIEDISFWYNQRHFTWRPDPAGGLIDFVSKPWVAVAKNHGDCDDMMAVARFVLKGNVDEMHRASCYSVDGGGHCVLVVRTGPEWTLVSNQHVKRGFADPQSAVRTFYGDKTGFVYIYGIGASFPEAT